MQTRQLGNSDLQITTVGLGTWAIGGGGWQYGWGPQDERASIASILEALEAGINWIDTAPVYGCGCSEEAVGKAVKEWGGPRPILATKCGLRWDDKGNVSGKLARESVLAEAEDSLRRLQVDVIDLYQIHWPNPPEQIEEGWQAVADLVEQGKIRYGGVSNFSVEQMQRVGAIRPITSLQPPYSMLKRDIETDILGHCAANGIGVIAYSPMQKGLLTGAWTPERVAGLPEDDHRTQDPMFHDPQFGRILDLVEKLKVIAAEYGKTVAQLAIAWTLRRPEVTAAIVGARKPGQIRETVGAGDWRLAAVDVAAIEDLLAGVE
jgi:aryl-alcohol dehydrogenase-like predicted oxidoreductase